MSDRKLHFVVGYPEEFDRLVLGIIDKMAQQAPNTPVARVCLGDCHIGDTRYTLITFSSQMLGRDFDDVTFTHNAHRLPDYDSIRMSLTSRLLASSRLRLGKTYRYKGCSYVVNKEVKVKHPVSRRWVAAVEYTRADNLTEFFVRDRTEFLELFKLDVGFAMRTS